MGKVMGDENKLANGYGTGEGISFKPYVLTKDVRKKGTRTNIKDWINGRMLHFLSQGEFWLYVLLRWRKDVVDIREQYPLQKEKVIRVAKELGIPAPRKILTTDLLVTKADGTLVAYSVKQDRRAIVYSHPFVSPLLSNVHPLCIFHFCSHPTFSGFASLLFSVCIVFSLF